MAQDPRLQHAQRRAVVIAVLLTITPSLGHTDDLAAPPDQFKSDELQLLKEEESVGIELQEGHPISSLSSEPYVMLEEDIRESGATDLPALLGKILGVGVPQVTGSEINRRALVGSEIVSNTLLVLVDGRPIRVDRSDPLTWRNIPVTLLDIQRLEMWKESPSAVHGMSSDYVVVKIITKPSGK
jgi:iron complex outermembrane receptor protein